MPLSMFIGRCTGYGSRPDDPVLHRCVLPQIGIATLELLERLGVDVVYPKEQTCCGQPMANSGCYEEARATEDHCARVLDLSSTLLHLLAVALITFEISLRRERILQKKRALSGIRDLVEFLHDVLNVREFPWRPLSTRWHFTQASAAAGQPRLMGCEPVSLTVK
jgi:L-lactate dehydrogenase complex protein LldE